MEDMTGLEVETLCRLILLNVTLFRDSARTDEDFDRMVRSMVIDVTSPKRLVSHSWLESHGFIDYYSKL